MPRGPRLDAPDALHHVIARGIERRLLFADDLDRQDFLDRLAHLVTVTHAGLFAWCLMPNHFHLLLRTGRVPLSTLMRRLLTAYAVTFNRRHRRAGHLFQNRFKSILVEADPYLLQLVRYIHLNPVRAHLVPSAEALDTYPWTGHAVLLGHLSLPAQDVGPVLSGFGRTVSRARRAYVAFIADGLQPGALTDLDGGGVRRSVGTWDRLARLGAGRERWRTDERILGSSAFVEQVLASAPPPLPGPPRPDAHAVVHQLCDAIGAHCQVAPAEIRSASLRRPAVAARALVCHLALTHYGLSLTATATALGVSKQSVLRGVSTGQARLASDRDTLPDGLLP